MTRLGMSFDLCMYMYICMYVYKYKHVSLYVNVYVCMYSYKVHYLEEMGKILVALWRLYIGRVQNQIAKPRPRLSFYKDPRTPYLEGPSARDALRGKSTANSMWPLVI